MQSETLALGIRCPVDSKMMFITFIVSGAFAALVLTRMGMSGVLALMPKKDNN